MVNKMKGLIVDVDGTLALRNTALENCRTPYDWARVNEDLPNKPIVDLVNNLYSKGFKVLIITARDSKYEHLTIEWLDENKINFDLCFSRPEGNNERDCTVKERIYREDIADYYDIEYVFEDRNSVVQMWRNLNLTCLQVAEGSF